jgi:hypothetical protein
LKRYGTLDYILQLDFNEGEEYITYVYEQHIDEQLYFRWVVGFQDKISYEEFKSEMLVSKNKTNDNRSSTEILDMVRQILDKRGATRGDI